MENKKNEEVKKKVTVKKQVASKKKVKSNRNCKIIAFAVVVIILLTIVTMCFSGNKYEKMINEIQFGMSSEQVEEILGVKGVDAKIELDPNWEGIYMNYTLDKKNNVIITIIYEDKANLTDVSAVYINDIEIKEYKNSKVTTEKIQKAAEKLQEIKDKKVVNISDIEAIIGVKATISSKEIDYLDMSTILTYGFVAKNSDYMTLEIKENHTTGIRYSIYKIGEAHYSVVQ